MAISQEDRLQLALRASREGIWDWDLVAGSIYYSSRVYRFLGYRKVDMPHLFDERHEHMDEASVAAVDEALRRVEQEGEDLFAVEPRVRTKRGEWKSFRVRGTPVRDELGKVIRIAGSLIDISKRKEAERQLAEERHLIETLLDNIPMNVYFKDRESRFVMANLPTAQKMGLESSSELVGKTDADFFSEEHAQHAREVEKEIMASGVGVEDLTEHEKWDDRPDTWVKSTKHAWLGQEDVVRGTFGVTIDISELIRNRDDLEEVTAQLNEQNLLIEEERERLRLVFDSVPLHLYFKNRDHEFVIANQAIADWFGVEKPEELYDKSDRDIFEKGHWEGTERDERLIMETGQPIVNSIEREVWRGRKDTYVMTSKYPWRNADGTVMGTYGVSADISDLVRAQAELRTLVDESEEKNRLMAEELDLAREVQMALLPEEFPKVKSGGVSLKFHRLYRSARELTGEFYEVLPLGEDRVGFLMGEVFDEGVRSALIVSMLRGLIEKEMASAEDPGAFLTGLNSGLSHLLLDSDHEIKATAFYGVIDLGKDTIKLSVAGHVNPIAVFEDGVRKLVPPSHAYGPPLGGSEETTYGTVTAPLLGLRRMICFTEGFKQGQNRKGEAFGLTRLLEEIERGGELARVMERVADAVTEFVGGELDKAVCLLGWEVKR